MTEVILGLVISIAIALTGVGAGSLTTPFRVNYATTSIAMGASFLRPMFSSN
jgi:hypothetical protein